MQSRFRTFLRDNLPESVKEPVKAGLRGYARCTSRWRVLPDWLIIGAQKAGTSSLFYYLQQHPRVAFAPDITKEVHYFDWNHEKGERWYRRHFPLRVRRDRPADGGPRLQAGEASPEYLFYPHVPERAASLVPGARCIAILRDPVERAYSHYKMNVRRGLEDLEFEEAIDAEPERLRAGPESLLENGRYEGNSYSKFSYLTRGRYAEQIDRWLQWFPAEQLLVLPAHEFYEDTERVYHRVLRFLGLEEWTPPDLEVVGLGGYGNSVSPGVRDRLMRRLEEDTRRLRQLVDWEPVWDHANPPAGRREPSKTYRAAAGQVPGDA